MLLEKVFSRKKRLDVLFADQQPRVNIASISPNRVGCERLPLRKPETIKLQKEAWSLDCGRAYIVRLFMGAVVVAFISQRTNHFIRMGRSGQ